MVATDLFVVLMVEFFAAPADKEDPHKIKTKPDEARGSRKYRYLLNIRHHLGNSIKNTQTRQYQCNCPDDLGGIHLFVGHGSTRSKLETRKKPSQLQNAFVQHA
jgi:hypothetical protein